MNNPILAYHLIDTRLHLGITWVTPGQFQRHMAWLADNGYRTGSLDDYLAGRLSARDVVLTFDDGYSNLAEYAFSALCRYGFRATVFPVVDYVGRQSFWDVNFFWRKKEHLSWIQLKDLLAAGWEIGSHSLQHHYLSALPAAELKSDLLRSRLILEDKLDVPIRHLSLPFGRGNKLVFESAREAGFVSVVTLGQRSTSRVFAKDEKDNERALHVIPRRGIYLHDTIRSFKRRVQAPTKSPSENFRQRCISSFSIGTILVKRAANLIRPPTA